jgi:hypothetical protein
MYQDYPSQMSGAHRLDLNGYTFSYSDSELQEHPATYATKYTWVNKKTGHKIRVYSKSKTVSKTYTVKIGNDGTMTNREYKRIKDSMTVGTVKGIVGAAGSVTSRYSVGGHEYITRSYDPGNVDCDEYSRWKTYTDIRQVFYDNGRVYAKLWT